MKAKQVILVSIGIMVGVMLGASVGQVEAAFFDRDKLSHALSVRFHLNEREVSSFLADFQYHPDDYLVASSPVPTSTPTPTPIPREIVKNNVQYQYDDGTDTYIRATKVVSVQHQNHLDFIEGRLDVEVANGQMTQVLKRDILRKLRQMMDKSPSSQEFLQMGLLGQRAAIGKFKKEMDAWLQSRGMTLAELSEITGKGNKYLMGIYFD